MQRIVWFVLVTFIPWITIYLVNSVIQPSSKAGLANLRGHEKFNKGVKPNPG